LKKEKPEVSRGELDIFSDLIWGGLFLAKVNTWKIFSAQQCIFQLQEEKEMKLILVLRDESRNRV